MGAYSDKKYEEARLKQRRTLDTAGLDDRLKVQGEPDVADIWSDQKRIQQEDKKVEYNYKQAKEAAKRLKKELRKNDRQSSFEIGKTLGSIFGSVKKVAVSALSKFISLKLGYKLATVAVVITIIGGVSLSFLRSDNSKAKEVLGASTAQATPDFATLAPGGDINSTQSKKLSFDAQKKVASYTDTVGGTPVTISQQVMPESFKANTVDELDKLAKQIYANEFIKGANVPAYVGTSAKGPQTAIFIKNNNLVFILSQSKIEIADWADYINSLK